MTTVAEYFAVLGLKSDAASFAQGDSLLSRIRETAGKAASALAAAFAVDAVKDFVVETLDAIPVIGDLADQTGIAAEEIQRLGFAADQSGSDAETLNAALLKFTKNLGNADSTEIAETLRKLGVNMEGIKKRNPADVLREVADGLSKVGSVSERAVLAQTLFGLSGAKLAPFLRQGSAAITELGDEAERLGLVLGRDTIDAVGSVDDRVKALEATVQGVSRSLVVTALPAIEALVDLLRAGAQLLTKGAQLIRQYRTQIAAVAVVVGTVLVGSLVRAAGAWIALNVAQLAASLTAGAVLPGAFFAVVTAIDKVARAALALATRLVAFIAPAAAVGAALAIVVLAVDDIITTLQGGESFFGSFSGKFGDLAKTLVAAAGDDGLGFVQRVFAGLGAVVVGAFALIDNGFKIFFDGIIRIQEIAGFVVDLFTSPGETIRAFFREAIADFSAFVGKAADIASKIAGFFGNARPTGVALAGPLKDLSAGLATVNQSDVSRALLSSPVVRASVTGSRTMNVGAPVVNVSVTGNASPVETGRAVANITGQSLEQTIRAARVDLIAGEG